MTNGAESYLSQPPNDNVPTYIIYGQLDIDFQKNKTLGKSHGFTRVQKQRRED